MMHLPFGVYGVNGNGRLNLETTFSYKDGAVRYLLGLPRGMGSKVVVALLPGRLEKLPAEIPSFNFLSFLSKGGHLREVPHKELFG